MTTEMCVGTGMTQINAIVENAELRQLLRDYQVWAQDGVEALFALSSAWNAEIWKDRYASLQERASELTGG